MTPRSRNLGLALVALLAAVVLPLGADGTVPDCFNPTTSLASTTRGPTTGDEQFFTLPVGPSNIMFVLDSSGSMETLPQCGDNIDASWGGTDAPAICQWPVDAVLSVPSSTGVRGTCDVSGDPNLTWMQTYTPKATPYDTGHPFVTGGLDDRPGWGPATCNSSSCMFQANQIYAFNSWTETSATPKTNCNPASGVTADDAACRKCLFGDSSTPAKGFYFQAYRDSSGNTGRYVLFSGGWLNANPPKFMAARKVIKDMVWIDPAAPSTLDQVRFGLAILSSSGSGARIVVPLGPDKPNSYPRNAAKFQQARQYILDALNRKISGLPSFMSGNTPMATTLFGVGQYFTSQGVYTAKFGSSFENSSLVGTTAGLVNAPWAQNNPNQCSICWGCQQNSIIVVTDGSPNSESTLPTAITGYDDVPYHNSRNCGPGDSCRSGVTATCPTVTKVTSTAALAGAVGTQVGRPATSCNGNNCRCSSGEPRINKNSNYCYTCPGSSTWRNPTSTCYWQCPNDTTQYTSSRTCYTTCSGDTTHYPPDTTTCPSGCTCPNDSTSYPSGSTCPSSMCCSPSDSTSNPPTSLPRIASWLHSNDLRTDLAVSDPQIISTYTVSFGLYEPTGTVNPAVQILRATANMGSGIFNNASDATSLASAVATAVKDVVERANSFSAPAAASLSTLRSVAVEAVLTRFKPNDSPMWEGHVYQGMLFDEFLNGCDATKGPTQADGQPQVQCGPKTVSANFDGNADVNGRAICTGVFLVDADCDEVVEDVQTGAFLKKSQGKTSANMFWDAGFVLSNPTYPTGHPLAAQPVPGYRSANDRTLYSVLNGQVTAFDAAHASSWAPFMNLSTSWCTAQLQIWGICGTAPLPACSSVVNQCAKAVIDFVHGWDVTDLDGDLCGAPGRQSNAAKCPDGADGEQRDRPNDARTASPTFWKLGDVFHSAPVIVRPPTDEFSCGTGFDNQCTATIFSPPAFPKQTSIVNTYPGLGTSTADAYEAYRLAHVDRQQVVLVGSNDGMLHAFDAGSPTGTTRNALGQKAYTKGTGEELWGFIPPDLLPKLKDMTTSHQYMVDGNVMVKEVWVDGSTANPAVGHSRDNVKQYGTGQEEFHTVAVVTERSGGTQYTALDITDVTAPKFLWSFPPAGSDDTRYMGQSWTDFAPGPPPIGPVRLALGSGVPDPTGRAFEERWIVFVNGGYDPTLTRGRAVWMVDVWTGAVVWRFTDDDFKTLMGFTSSTSMFPVTASVGAVDIGDTTQPITDRDGFFDTATWGDLGGNVFVARFWEPGNFDGTTASTNWFASRTFEEQRRTDGTQWITGRSPFFLMADNVYDATTHTLRTFVGSGNRERSMTTGNECTADNLLGCCAAGCTTVHATFADEFGSCTRSGAFDCSTGQLRLDRTSSNCGSPLTCGTFETTATVQFTCPGSPAATVVGEMSCDATGICTPATNLGTSAYGTVPPPSWKSRFYGIWSFGGAAGKRFDTQAQAVAFDANRFTDVAYTGCSGPAGNSCTLVDVTQATVSFNPASPLLSTVSCASGTKCSANSSDPGWYFQYGDRCPLSSCSPAPPWFDEKTGAGASTVLGCTSWASFRPVGADASGTDPCTGTAGNPQTYGYLADYLTGAPSATCGYSSTVPDANLYVRATQRTTIAAPNSPTIRVVVNAAGEVKYQGLEFPPGTGASGMVQQTDFGTRTDTSEMIYWLEVPRDLHACRHDPVTSQSTCE